MAVYVRVASGGSEGSEDETETTERERKLRRYKRKGSGIELIGFFDIITSEFTESAGSLSPRSVANMKVDIENERARLMATKGLAEGERNDAQKELEEREEELRKAQEQQQELENKLNELNSKVSRFVSCVLFC